MKVNFITRKNAGKPGIAKSFFTPLKSDFSVEIMIAGKK
jgi:hypothetical protein